MAAWYPGVRHRPSEHEGPPGLVAPLLVPTPDPDSEGSQIKDGLIGLTWSEPVASLRPPAVNSAPVFTAFSLIPPNPALHTTARGLIQEDRHSTTSSLAILKLITNAPSPSK